MTVSPFYNDKAPGSCIWQAEYRNINYMEYRIEKNIRFANLWLKISIPFFRRRQWHTTPVLLPGESHGQRSLVGCSSWGHEESDTTERLHFSFSCIGEGNGNPLQYSCLENPRDGVAWWAAVYGVAQSRTRLKRLSRAFLSSSFSFQKRSLISLSPALQVDSLPAELPGKPLQTFSYSRNIQKLIYQSNKSSGEAIDVMVLISQ